jgi:hypothetical protein
MGRSNEVPGYLHHSRVRAHYVGYVFNLIEKEIDCKIAEEKNSEAK